MCVQLYPDRLPTLQVQLKPCSRRFKAVGTRYGFTRNRVSMLFLLAPRLPLGATRFEWSMVKLYNGAWRNACKG